jgi:hypothetical protein
MLAMLIEKYQWQLEEDRRYRVAQGVKRDRSSRLGIDLVGRRFGVVEISRGTWHNTLPIGNPG